MLGRPVRSMQMMNVHCCLFFFVQAYKAFRRSGENHNATLRTLDVLYFLLVVEGQGVHPRASGIRKQVWVWSADTGVCHVWKAAGKVSK